MKLTDLLFTPKYNDPMAIILSADYKLEAEIELINITKLNKMIASAMSLGVASNLINDRDYSLSELVIAYENRREFLYKLSNISATAHHKEVLKNHPDATFWINCVNDRLTAIVQDIKDKINLDNERRTYKAPSKELKIVRTDSQFAAMNTSGTKTFKGTVEIKVSDSYAAHLDINLFIAPARGDDHRYLSMTHTRNLLTVSYAMYEKLHAIALQKEAESKSAA